MSNMEIKLVKLLMDHDFYEANKSRVVPTMFPDELGTIYSTICEAHKRYERTVTVEEVKALHKTLNPTLTRAQKNNIAELFYDIEEEDDVKSDIAKDVLSYMWKMETFREIADLGLKGMEGKMEDLSPFLRIIEARGDDFLPVDDIQPVTTDLDEIIAAHEDRACWEFNIPSIHSKVPGLAGGDFMILFARPETGKTAAYVSLTAAPGGFLWQGAKVAYLGNEEPVIRTNMRCITAAAQMTKEDVIKNPSEARNTWDQIKANFIPVDNVDMSMARLDAWCKRVKPDILIIDQLDKVKVSGTFGATHEKLREVYVQAREIAKRHNIAVIGISQASADAEGKTQIHYSQMEGSKTGKAAEADLIFGIGKEPDEDAVERHWTCSKNKITGWHGRVVTVLKGETSTYHA